MPRPNPTGSHGINPPRATPAAAHSPNPAALGPAGARSGHSHGTPAPAGPAPTANSHLRLASSLRHLPPPAAGSLAEFNAGLNWLCRIASGPDRARRIRIDRLIAAINRLARCHPRSRPAVIV